MMAVERVAYVLKSFPQLTQTFVIGELAELRRRGIEVMIVSLRKPSEALRHAIVAEAGLEERTVYDSAQFLSRLIEFKPQILHAHFATQATAAARTFASEIRVPFTVTAHGYDIYFRPPKDFHERAMAAAALVTVSEANQRHITSTFDVPREHIHVIPNGVDIDFFCPASDPFVSGRQPPLIVCVARHETVKNLPLLLEACAILRDRGIEFRCVIIGDGAERNNLETMRHTLALDGIVEMTGELERAKVLRWWRRATVTVLSSDSEGMPVSLIEAAACGVPAVAPCVGGIPEFVADGVTGLLTPPRDSAALANALAQILNDPLRAAEMGQAARSRVRDQFSLSLQVDRLLAMWRAILEKPRLDASA
jgi:glycosyltransferase involved in cell wall biosynthesis